jgi:hypothetical protein
MSENTNFLVLILIEILQEIYMDNWYNSTRFEETLGG